MSNLPGAYLDPAEMQPPPYSPMPPGRNGIFPDIGQFMAVPEHDPPLQLSYRIASIADLRAGRIIYIRDQQTRLDQRVMLVLRKSNAGFTCIPFCLHQIPPSYVDHWVVRAALPTDTNNTSQRRSCLKVVLTPYPNAPQLHPQNNITINIGDIWNVENVVNVAVLGYVKPRHLIEIFGAVKNHFCHSLDRSLRELEQSSGGPPANNASRRRRS